MSDDFTPSRSDTNFRKAVLNLERSLDLPILEPRDASGIIKDFEMAYELSWKVLKRVLLEEGNQSLGAKDVFRQSYRFGLLSEEETWLEMIADRNKTSHVYDENMAQAIIARIKGRYLSAFQNLKIFLEKRPVSVSKTL